MELSERRVAILAFSVTIGISVAVMLGTAFLVAIEEGIGVDTAMPRTNPPVSRYTSESMCHRLGFVEGTGVPSAHQEARVFHRSCGNLMG